MTLISAVFSSTIQLPNGLAAAAGASVARRTNPEKPIFRMRRAILFTCGDFSTIV
jgi:hypothetical protein